MTTEIKDLRQELVKQAAKYAADECGTEDYWEKMINVFVEDIEKYEFSLIAAQPDGVLIRRDIDDRDIAFITYVGIIENYIDRV